MLVTLEKKSDCTIVQVDNDDLLDMLVERVKLLEKDDEVVELYKQMYRNAIDNEVFNGKKFSVNKIVDNDVINYCRFCSRDEITLDDWDKLKEHYKNGNTNISCESFDFEEAAFIEAMTDEAVLLRLK